MSEIAGIIDTLEDRISKLFARIEGLEKHIGELNCELEKSRSVVVEQTATLSELKSDCETLRLANALLGSEENKRDTKLKINSLIREIDYCISQLAD
ncbi:MAG: hypothetical protein EOO51_09815 [Flavobacterium sp.]|nr:MAG: hypothetical protein EOO51_09815 [Flavobacterium sp.]